MKTGSAAPLANSKIVLNGDFIRQHGGASGSSADPVTKLHHQRGNPANRYTNGKTIIAAAAANPVTGNSRQQLAASSRILAMPIKRQGHHHLAVAAGNNSSGKTHVLTQQQTPLQQLQHADSAGVMQAVSVATAHIQQNS